MRAYYSRPYSWLLICLAVFLLLCYSKYQFSGEHLPAHVSRALDRCYSLEVKPGPSRNFHERLVSDRFEHGTKPVLLLNATVWTGENDGTKVVRNAAILIDNGIIKRIGHVAHVPLSQDLVIYDLHGSWVTPGIVDMHSHLGDSPSPELDATQDDNSIKSPISPWMRSLDGLNTHDAAFPLTISGGVTTVLVLPGSANAIGGQGFPIKLRKTSEMSSSSMLLEPPSTINSSFYDHKSPLHWRHMKHACGENPSSVYSQTRMDTVWNFRDAYNQARQLRESQDAFCSKAKSGRFYDLGEFPEDLRWEPLSEVLRGRVKVQVHCYETVDLDAFIRVSNEFKFPITAFHHAHETYLVPDLLKKAYGSPPGVAMFSVNARYKREAYRGSEYASRILADAGIQVALKSDHPVTNSRYLLFEAQNAYYYGLPENLAIASVTSTPAKLLGLDHRIGYVKEGWDADLVVFDSHPLSLGATPSQVFIDGIPQLKSPYTHNKPSAFQRTPQVPNFDKEAKEALEYEGLPPLLPRKPAKRDVLFLNVKNVFTPVGTSIQSVALSDNSFGSLLVRNGRILCSGELHMCADTASTSEGLDIVDLKGGSVSPALVSFGAPLGLQEIDAEPSTGDGSVLDPLMHVVPKILQDGEGSVISAVDGLQFAGRDTLYAYRHGVTVAVSAPRSSGLFAGLSVAFSTGASHKLEGGAIVQDISALHVTIGHFGPSISTQIAALRRLLLEPTIGGWFERVAQGKMPLVVQTHKADVMATLVLLKSEVEKKSRVPMQLTISGANEAHLLAKELGEANVGIILNPVRPFPASWDALRILPGPPLTKEGQVSTLLAHNVTVGVGVVEAWEARNTRFDIGWAALESGGKISKADAIALGSTNLYKLLGVNIHADDIELVATMGGDLLGYESKVVAVISPDHGVDLLG